MFNKYFKFFILFFIFNIHSSYASHSSVDADDEGTPLVVPNSTPVTQLSPFAPDGDHPPFLSLDCSVHGQDIFQVVPFEASFTCLIDYFEQAAQHGERYPGYEAAWICVRKKTPGRLRKEPITYISPAQFKGCPIIVNQMYQFGEISFNPDTRIIENCESIHFVRDVVADAAEHEPIQPESGISIRARIVPFPTLGNGNFGVRDYLSEILKKGERYRNSGRDLVYMQWLIQSDTGNTQGFFIPLSFITQEHKVFSPVFMGQVYTLQNPEFMDMEGFGRIVSGVNDVRIVPIPKQRPTTARHKRPETKPPPYSDLDSD